LKPPTGGPKRADYKTKADVVAFVKKSFADGAAVIEAKGDGGMNDLVKSPFANQQDRISDLAWSLSSTRASITGSWWSITAWRGWFRRSRVRRSETGNI